MFEHRPPAALRTSSSIAIAFLLGSVPLAAKQKTATGTIGDLAAFAKIRSYCVDSSELPNDEAYDVTGFVKSESRPGKLLSKLHWKLLADCGQSDHDAVVTFEFPRIRMLALQAGAPPNPSDGCAADYHTAARLRVLDAATRQAIYQIQAQPLDNPSITDPICGEARPVQRYDAMYRAFWNLAQDITMVAREVMH